MKDTTKLTLTKGQALALLLEEERAEQLDDRIEAMSHEEHVAAIESAGISRSEQEAYFERQRLRVREAIARNPAPENVVPIRSDVMTAPARKRWLALRDVAFFGTGGALTTAAALLLRVVTAASELPPSITTAAASAPDPAEELRHEAFDACGRGHFSECLGDFDRAKQLDPDGDRSDDVQHARKLAQDSTRSPSNPQPPTPKKAGTP